MPLSPQLFKGIITWNMTCHITAWIDWRVYLRLMWNKNFWYALRKRWWASTAPGLPDPPKCLALCPSTAKDAPVTIRNHYSCMIRLCKAQFGKSWPIIIKPSPGLHLLTYQVSSVGLQCCQDPRLWFFHINLLVYWYTDILIYWYIDTLI